MRKRKVNDASVFDEIRAMETLPAFTDAKVPIVRDPTTGERFAQYEPKWSNRFIVRFGPPFEELPEWIVSECDRPTFTFNTLTPHYEDMSFALKDPIGPSTAQRCNDVVRALMGSRLVNDGFNNPQGLTTITIEMLDPVGIVIERWLITGMLYEIRYGSLSYDNDNPIMIYLTFGQINAQLEF